MNEPIVTHLYYELKLSDELAFDNPPPLEQDLSDFKFVLNAGQLDITMKSEVPTEAQARDIVEPYLKSWETDHFLKTGRKEFWFNFNNSVIVDKNPTGTGGKVIHAGLGEIILVGHEITLKLTKRNYPTPEFSLAITPDVESLLNRYEGFIKKKEPLLSMAYFCLTFFEAAGGNRKKASVKFNIEYDVLDKLGELTSTRGDMTESRKAKGSLQPLTPKETDWIIAAIRTIIRRKAEYDYNPKGDFGLIDLATLPTLS